MPRWHRRRTLPDFACVEPVCFLQTCFRPNDWIAVFLKNYQNGRVAQHIGPLSWAMSEHVHAWLHAMNDRRFTLHARHVRRTAARRQASTPSAPRAGTTVATIATSASNRLKATRVAGSTG